MSANREPFSAAHLRPKNGEVVIKTGQIRRRCKVERVALVALRQDCRFRVGKEMGAWQKNDGKNDAMFSEVRQNICDAPSGTSFLHRC